jgi:hypothetical protein
VCVCEEEKEEEEEKRNPLFSSNRTKRFQSFDCVLLLQEIIYARYDSTHT